MIEVYSNLYVGSQLDEEQIRDEPGWYVVHACKEPYHRDALGYTGRAAPKDHPEYLIARRGSAIILNLVDAADPNYIPREIIDAAVDAIHNNIATSKVLVHCNQGMSRSPSIALLYLAKHSSIFTGLSAQESVQKFVTIYPHYQPAVGVQEYVRRNWHMYAAN